MLEVCFAQAFCRTVGLHVDVDSPALCNHTFQSVVTEISPLLLGYIWAVVFADGLEVCFVGGEVDGRGVGGDVAELDGGPVAGSRFYVGKNMECVFGEELGECGVALGVEGEDFDGRCFFDGTLGGGVEGAEAVDFVAEEFDADGVFFCGRPEVDDAAAARGDSFFIHFGIEGVPQIFQGLENLIWGMFIPRF